MKETPAWTGQEILQRMGGFREACVIAAAAELDVWSLLGDQSLTAEELARRMNADLRATTMLLDAMTALGFLEKTEGRYGAAESLRPWLTGDTPQTVLPMILHQANMIRSWSQLAWTTRAGTPYPRPPSVRGPAADRAAFIAAMHSVSGPMADELVAKLQPLISRSETPVSERGRDGTRSVPATFSHLLDVGGASGTWTLAFLRAAPDAKATIFDLPDAMVQARQRIEKTQFAGRITLVGGDFYTDDLPPGADFAWVSAIVHQHSRQHNRDLFVKVFNALEPGGRIAVRDVVMQPDRTQPRDGALFAINMLVNTESGGTFTFEEIAEDLQTAGFTDPQWAIRDEGMQSVVLARKVRDTSVY